MEQKKESEVVVDEILKRYAKAQQAFTVLTDALKVTEFEAALFSKVITERTSTSTSEKPESEKSDQPSDQASAE